MSVFTKLITGELPCYKIFEDDLVFSFLALDQVNLGHTLVIPKLEVNHWFDTPEKDFLRVSLVSQKVAKAIKAATDCPRVGTITAGFEVPHFHIHLIPAWGIPELTFTRAQRRSNEDMTMIQKKIIESLKF